MKETGDDKGAPDLAAEQNDESSVPSHSVPKTNSSGNLSKKSASSSVIPPSFPRDSSSAGPSAARPRSRKTPLCHHSKQSSRLRLKLTSKPCSVKSENPALRRQVMARMMTRISVRQGDRFGLVCARRRTKGKGRYNQVVWRRGEV